MVEKVGQRKAEVGQDDERLFLYLTKQKGKRRNDFGEFILERQ